MGLAGTRLAMRRGKFWYRHRATDTAAERWEDCGTDLALAKERANLYNEPGRAYGTVGYWLDRFIVACEARVKAGTLSARTLADYRANVVPLKVFFGPMLVGAVRPNHVSTYLRDNEAAGRPVPANRERACLSAMISWLLRSPECPPGLTTNPCMRAAGVTRNEETKRELYVEDAWYRAVYDAASPEVRLLMELTYRTLQRPESDIIAWTPAIIKTKGDGKILHFRQGKTGRLIDIGLEGRLLELVEDAAGTIPVLRRPLIYATRGKNKGKAYTYSGIAGMLRKVIYEIRAEHEAQAKAVRDALRLQGFGAHGAAGVGSPRQHLRSRPRTWVKVSPTPRALTANSASSCPAAASRRTRSAPATPGNPGSGCPSPRLATAGAPPPPGRQSTGRESLRSRSDRPATRPARSAFSLASAS